MSSELLFPVDFAVVMKYKTLNRIYRDTSYKGAHNVEYKKCNTVVTKLADFPLRAWNMYIRVQLKFIGGNLS